MLSLTSACRALGKQRKNPLILKKVSKTLKPSSNITRRDNVVRACFFSDEPFKVTAGMVKALREQTGAPMMECKKALVAAKGDPEAATEWLRKQGVAAAASKSGRDTSDGLIALVCNPQRTAATLLEVSSETDFVARNETFQELVTKLAEISFAAKTTNIESLKAVPYSDDETAGEALIRVTATIRENLALKEVDFVEMKEGFGTIGTYIHNKRGDILGTQASLVAIESSDELGEKEKIAVQALADSLAIHLVGAQAMYMKAVPQEVIDKEREILSEATRKEMEENAIKNSKQVDEDVMVKRIKKKVDKRIVKLTEELALEKQKFVSENADGKTNVLSVLNQTSKDLGTKLKIKTAIRYQIGNEKVQM